MPRSIAYASFFVRVWRSVDGDLAHSSAGWHSEIEHIQTGERWGFERLQELLDFLRREAQDSGTLGAMPDGC